MRLHPSCSRSWSGAQINCSPNIHIQRGTHDSCFISVRYFILGVSRKHQYKTSLFFGHELNKRMLQFFPEMLKFNWFFWLYKKLHKKAIQPWGESTFLCLLAFAEPGVKNNFKRLLWRSAGQISVKHEFPTKLRVFSGSENQMCGSLCVGTVQTVTALLSAVEKHARLEQWHRPEVKVQ